MNFLMNKTGPGSILSPARHMGPPDWFYWEGSSSKILWKIISWHRSNSSTGMLCPWGCPSSNQTGPRAKQQNFKAAPRQSLTKWLQRALPPPLICASVPFHMEKWKVGVGENSLLSKYSSALKQSDAKGQIIRRGKERNVMFYFHYRPQQLYRWVMLTNNVKS